MTDFVLFDVIENLSGAIGLITLNRENSLHALNLEMVELIYKQLQKWKNQTEIKLVVVKSLGNKAFCAGGDLKFLYANRENDAPLHFFKAEYELTKLIYHYPKPYLTYANGLTFGGGVGLSFHGSHVIGSDTFKFAMPEVAIGFFPDVGGTFLLSRLKKFFGIYLALSATAIDIHTARAIDLIHHKMSENEFENFMHSIAENLNSKIAVSDLIDELLISYAIEKNHAMDLNEHLLIEEIFNAGSLDEVFANLRAHENTKAQQILTQIQKHSPLSLKITWEALKRAKTKTFDACMAMEWQLAKHFINHSDFFAGIDAKIISKTHQPKWSAKNFEAFKFCFD